MGLRIFYNGIFGLLLLVLQAGFVNALPGPVAGLNLVLVAGVYILGSKGLMSSLAWTLPLALLLDLLSFGLFGYSALCYAAALWLAFYLQQGFFTNRSLYSFLAIALFSDLVFRTLASGGQFTAAYFRGSPLDVFSTAAYWLSQSYALAADLALVILVFYALNFLSRRYQPVFLGRSRM